MIIDLLCFYEYGPWRQKIGWDENLGENLLQEWQKIVELLKCIPSIQIPCQILKLDVDTHYDMLCFCDASKEAFTTTIYIRTERQNEVNVNLVFTKSPLCPLTGLTVPRAELMAVLIGTRCMQYVKKHLNLHFRNFCLWTDSKIVLGWLKKESNDQGIFVNNRVMEVLNFPDLKFAYVPTDQNPADFASKSRENFSNLDWNLWWHGPQWLKEPVEDWPPFECLDTQTELF